MEADPELVSDSLALLRQAPLFESLSDEESERLAARATRFTMPPGPLFYEGDRPTNAYLLLVGEVDLTVCSSDGRSLLLYKIWPGDLFGELGLVDDQPRSATAIARTRCEMLSFSREVLLDVVARNPAIALRLIGLLSQRLRVADATIKSITFQDMTARLAATLLRLEREQQGRGAIRTNHAELAEALACTRQSVTRTIALWRQLGYVETGRGWLRIRNRRLLQAYADMDIG
jgi:CRP-like cAMP-binding protein